MCNRAVILYCTTFVYYTNDDTSLHYSFIPVGRKIPLQLGLHDLYAWTVNNQSLD